jgi:integrase/recombinase XerC
MNKPSTDLVLATPHTLDRAVDAWLDATCSRSQNTRKAYEDTITLFRSVLWTIGLDLDSTPAGNVALVAQKFAWYSAREGYSVATSTANLRLSILSSFYRYCQRKGTDSPLYLERNPIEQIDRATVQDYAAAQPLHQETVSTALAAINQETAKGARDYALLSILFQTARRAQEVAQLQWRSIEIGASGKATLTFEHTKGDETMIDEVPVSVTGALLRWKDRYPKGVWRVDGPVWISLAHDPSYGQQLGYQTIRTICTQVLGVSKVHATRHTTAYYMEKLGLTVSEIQARLGHKSLATTGRYLASLKRAENRKGDELAAAFGIE